MASCVSFSPDDTIVAASIDKTVHLWRVADGSIPVHYDVEDYEQDLVTLKELGWT
jgi:WD40 repeat protein